MDNEQKFWISIWKLVVVAFLSLVLTIGGCTAYGYKKSAALLEAGYPAVDVRCTLPNGDNTDAACAMSGSKLNNTQ